MKRVKRDREVKGGGRRVGILLEHREHGKREKWKETKGWVGRKRDNDYLTL